MDKRLGVETISELQIWIEGKFDLITQAQSSIAEDVRQVRGRVHDLGNEVAKLLALDISGKFERLERADTEHEANIKVFLREAAERRGAAVTMKALYAIAGIVIGYLVAIGIALLK